MQSEQAYFHRTHRANIVWKHWIRKLGLSASGLPWTKRCFLILGVLLVTSCATKASVLRVVPAKYKIENIRSIVILPLVNSASEEPWGAQYITESLYKSLIWRKFFEEVKHVAASETFNYHQIKDMSPEFAADIGRREGVDAFVKGEVFAFRMTTESTTKRVEREEGTGQYRTIKRTENGQVKTDRIEIMKKVVEDVPIVKKKARVGFVLDIANVKQRRWTDHERFYKEKQFSAEGKENIESLMPSGTVLRDISSELVTQAADSFVPHVVAEKRKLAKDRACKDGLVMAKKADWKGALSSWTEAVANDPQNHAAHYNMGVAYEAIKDYKSAKDSYEKAARLSDKKHYRDAANSIKAILEDEARLIIQMKGRGDR